MITATTVTPRASNRSGRLRAGDQRSCGTQDLVLSRLRSAIGDGIHPDPGLVDLEEVDDKVIEVDVFRRVEKERELLPVAVEGQFCTSKKA